MPFQHKIFVKGNHEQGRERRARFEAGHDFFRHCYDSEFTKQRTPEAQGRICLVKTASCKVERRSERLLFAWFPHDWQAEGLCGSIRHLGCPDLH